MFINIVLYKMADVKYWYDRATICQVLTDDYCILEVLLNLYSDEDFEEQDLHCSENCARFWLVIIEASIWTGFWQWSSPKPDNWITMNQHSREIFRLFFEIMLYKKKIQMSKNPEYVFANQYYLSCQWISVCMFAVSASLH